MVDLQQLIEELSERIEEGASHKAVFGQPVQLEDRIVIPVAKVRWGGGGGGGGGPAERDGAGGGMGLGVSAAPVGFIEVTKHGAIFNSIHDPSLTTRYVLAWAVAAYLALSGLRKLFRG
ncbi:MAG: GerW family sporulation protein [Acidimicrobiia bacterium]